MASVRGHLIPDSGKLTINITVHLYLLFKTLLSDQILNSFCRKPSLFLLVRWSFQIRPMKLTIPEVIWGCCSISLFNRSCHPQGRGKASTQFPTFPKVSFVSLSNSENHWRNPCSDSVHHSKLLETFYCFITITPELLGKLTVCQALC